MPQTPNNTYYSPSNAGISSSYDVEFDDALLDLAGWKNPRFEGSKLTGERRNQFNSGDVSYGLNPVVEQKTACIFLGKDIDEGDALDKDTPLTEIMNHSYLTIDKILFINSETDDVEIVARENMNERAFNRLVTENFPEGSSSAPITVVPTYNAAILFSTTGFLPKVTSVSLYTFILDA